MERIIICTSEEDSAAISSAKSKSETSYRAGEVHQVLVLNTKSKGGRVRMTQSMNKYKQIGCKGVALENTERSQIHPHQI